MFLSLILLAYYCAITLGIALLGLRLLRRIPLFSNTEQGLLLLLAAGLFPAAVAAIGYAQLFRIPYMPQLSGLALALYGLRQARTWRPAFPSVKATWPLLLAGGIFVLTLAVTHWCYLEGGLTNWPRDEIRGLSFTSAFAANYLKPAHPTDLSVPISYSYYLFEYTAFLYAAVNGLDWPTLPILMGIALSITMFYLTFVRLLRVLLPSSIATDTFAVLMVSFYGLDIFAEGGKIAQERRHIEWWHGWHSVGQITQMASLWNWAYHYLAGAAFCFAAILCLHGALMRRKSDMLVLCAVFSCIGITFAGITGLFFAGCIFCSTLLLLWREGGTARWLVKEIPARALIWLPLVLLVLAPQFYSFYGREPYVSFAARPHLWFVHISLHAASIDDWTEFFTLMWYELGPLLFAAFLSLPLYLWKARGERFTHSFLLSLALGVFVAVSCMQSSTPDWEWRSGGFGFVILLALIATYWFTRLRAHVSAKLLWGATLLLLLPCVWNFYAEQRFRYEDCKPAPQYLKTINQKLDLHVPAAKVPFLDENIYRAGRIAITADNQANYYLHVYSLSRAFLDEHFDLASRGKICSHTWFGSNIPGSDYVEITRVHRRLVLHYQSCNSGGIGGTQPDSEMQGPENDEDPKQD